MIITIDGPAGTGKSTVSRKLAERLGFFYVDTGAMYRAITLFLMKHKAKTDVEIAPLLKKFTFYEKEGRYYVNGEEVTTEIRTPEVTSRVSEVSAKKAVREVIVELQRNLATGSDVVFEGRDMGTVVFPRADLKIFLTASPEVRAKRRYHELVEKYPAIEQQMILEEIKKRDHLDSTRELSPLKRPQDAYRIDTSNLTIDQVVDKILKKKRKKERLRLKMKWGYRCILSFVNLFFKVFYRHEVYGLHHFPRGAAIIAANHASFLDPPALAISCPEEVHFLARKSLFHIPLFSWLIRYLNTHSVSGKAMDIATFKEIVSLLKKGKKVLVFPEGTRSFDGRVEKIKEGAGFLAYLAKADILPTYIQGTFHVWGRKKRFPKFYGKTRCVFGKPIVFQEFEHLEKKIAIQKITERLRESLIQLEVWCKGGCKGEVP